jgi:hypothetical protein
MRTTASSKLEYEAFKEMEGNKRGCNAVAPQPPLYIT